MLCQMVTLLVTFVTPKSPKDPNFYTLRCLSYLRSACSFNGNFAMQNGAKTIIFQFVVVTS